MYKHSIVSNPRDTVSRASLNASNKNVHCQSVLNHELEVLEKERIRHLKSIAHDAQQIRQHLSDRSPSPTSRVGSASCGRAGSASPRRGSNCPTTGSIGPRIGSAASRIESANPRVGSASPTRNDAGRKSSHDNPSDDTLSSPPKSPRSSALLPRRKSSNLSNSNGSSESHSKSTGGLKIGEHAYVTEHGSNIMRPLSAVRQDPSVTTNSSHQTPSLTPPQIIVSDETEQPASRVGRRGSSSVFQVITPGRQGSSGSGSEPRHHGIDNEHSHALGPPVQRLRSNSMPSVVALPSITRPPARRPSYCPDPGHSSDLHVPESPRQRSSSFTGGIMPVRRRGSISEQWGSISERKKPMMGNLRGRRGSIDMDGVLRDLMYGVEHKELMGPSKNRVVTDKQWEELKNCRYLRMPEETSEENED